MASKSQPSAALTDETALAGLFDIATKYGYLCGALGLPADLPRLPFQAGVCRLVREELSLEERRGLQAAVRRAFAPPPEAPQSPANPTPHASSTSSADATAL